MLGQHTKFSLKMPFTESNLAEETFHGLQGTYVLTQQSGTS